MTAEPLSPDDLRAVFDSTDAYTVGLEEEVMLLEPETLALTPAAEEVLARVNGDPRFKAELPASQVEIVTEPVHRAHDAVGALMQARRDLAQRTEGLVRLGVAGTHPFSSGIGELSRLPRYERTIREYGPVAARELVCALQVHVSLGDADRALAVHDAARSFLPLLAALAANAPFYEGRDTGLASVRPKLAELLPRHGVPPPLRSWDEYASALSWGAATGAFPDSSTWWWELRLHPGFGTLELRVPDGQTTVADVEAIVVIAHALVRWLGDRHDAGERLRVDPAWKIAENSWSACRWGVEGTMIDLASASVRSTRECLSELLDELEPTAALLAAPATALSHARQLIERNGAISQRLVAADGGVSAVAGWLAGRFPEPWGG